jgi:hypothetical protein
VRKKIIVTLIGAVVSAFFITFFASHPQVSASNGQEFFDNYYRQVTQADRREVLFQEDLTPDFQDSRGGAPAFNRWWATQKRVVVDRVDSVSDNPFEFTVWLTYYPVFGRASLEVASFSLVCNGYWASFMARIPTFGCPVGHLKIESSLNVTTTAAAN